MCLKKIILVFLVFWPYYIFSQSLSNSTQIENSSKYVYANGSEKIYSTHLFLGPETKWKIDGTVEIWAHQIWIDPKAQISGQGKLIIYNPGNNPFYEDSADNSTVLDGNNGNFIQLLIENKNTKGIILDDIQFDGYPGSKPSGTLSAKLNIDNQFHFSEKGSHIYLNGNDLSIGLNGVISNAGPQQMFIIDAAEPSHLIKNVAKNNRFVFPIGNEIEDFNPVTISNSQNSGWVHVSLMNERNSGINLKNSALGLKKVWNIFSPERLVLDMTFEHEKNNENLDYNDHLATLIQSAGGQNIHYLQTFRTGENIHLSPQINLASQSLMNTSWFSKYSGFEENIEIPNSFSPNGDGIEDYFEIKGLFAFDQINLTIFDRSGKILFTKIAYDNKWNGNSIPDGTYYYYLSMKKGNVDRSARGFVVIKR